MIDDPVKIFRKVHKTPLSTYIQMDTLLILRSYTRKKGLSISYFIEQSIKEKINNDTKLK